MTWFLERAKEGSTWRGLAVLLTAVGVKLSPELMDSIVSAGLAVAGMIGIFWAEKKK